MNGQLLKLTNYFTRELVSFSCPSNESTSQTGVLPVSKLFGKEENFFTKGNVQLIVFIVTLVCFLKLCATVFSVILMESGLHN